MKRQKFAIDGVLAGVAGDSWLRLRIFPKLSLSVRQAFIRSVPLSRGQMAIIVSCSCSSSNVQQQLLTPRAPQIYGLARAESLADMK
ncbi:MAG: hypothetical protein Q9177_003461 [Variospora cf. flavescens]